MDKILYKLDTFEGPLDLLLTLIQKNKVSIYDIPIVEITAQYLEAIDGIEEANLDNTSEFLVMASNLLYIKSKMLLPKNEASFLGSNIFDFIYKRLDAITRNSLVLSRLASSIPSIASRYCAVISTIGMSYILTLFFCISVKSKSSGPSNVSSLYNILSIFHPIISS